MNAVQPAAKTNLQETETQRATIRKSVSDGAPLTGPYLAMNVAAAFSAGFGLMENSSAVIIGAMLIAMLYGPILGIAMALAEADTRLLGRAMGCRSCWSNMRPCNWLCDRSFDATLRGRQ